MTATSREDDGMAVAPGCRRALAALTLLLLPLFALPAAASERVALVIGNAGCAHAPRLANPLNDAADIGAAFERLGFAVTGVENADQGSMRRALQDFAKAASASEIALVFYAGHGIEVDRRNFLVPVDARLLSDADVEFETVPLELVSRAVERARGLALVILDACRENPFAASMQRAGATRAIGRGLARIEPSGETLVAYAAKEGTVASDGRGRNSPYSAALLALVEEPGLELGLMFRKVRDAVLAATGGAQEPFVYGSLSSDGVYFTGAPATAAGSAVDAGLGEGPAGSDGPNLEQLAARAYEAAERLDTAAAYEAVVERFPDSVFADLARGQLRKLAGGVAADGETAGAAAPAATPAGQIAAAPAPPPPAALADPEAAESALGLGRADRRSIQAGLVSLGFDPGPADGLFGRKTRTALSEWQAAKGEAATGWLTAAEAGVLKVAGEEALRGQAEAERVARAREASRPGRVFRDCDECPEIVVVPAGSFTMGSPESEEGRWNDEGPQHRVTIARPFAVGRYEVTRGEFARFVSVTGRSAGDSCRTLESGEGKGRSGRGWQSPGYRQTDGEPAVCVSWGDARAYARWLSRETGQEYRLLSESEWEYAARAGTRSSRWWGDGEAGQCGLANGYDRTGAAELDLDWDAARCSDGYVVTSPAGVFSANGFGLHDMSGNVWEWVEDCWHDSYAGAPSDGGVWTTGGDCSQRVLRGGSWIDPPQDLRAALRVGDDSGIRNVIFGFRVARTLAP